jgi:hypothetical protein
MENPSHRLGKYCKAAEVTLLELFMMKIKRRKRRNPIRTSQNLFPNKKGMQL